MAKSKKKQEKKPTAKTKDAAFATLANANRETVNRETSVAKPSAESAVETRKWSQENKK